MDSIMNLSSISVKQKITMMARVKFIFSIAGNEFVLTVSGFTYLYNLTLFSEAQKNAAPRISEAALRLICWQLFISMRLSL